MLQKMVLYPCLIYKQHYGLSMFKKKKTTQSWEGKVVVDIEEILEQKEKKNGFNQNIT